MGKICSSYFFIFFALLYLWSIPKSFAQHTDANYALQLEGTDEIVIPHFDKTSFGKSVNMTLEVWFKRTHSRPYYHIFGKQEVCSDFHNNYRLTGKDGKLHFSSSGGSISVDFNPEINEWIHIAITYNGTHLSIYINGCLQVEQVYNLGGKNEEPLRIGNAGNCPTNQGFIGLIDEVRIWNVCRSPHEILAYYNTSVDPKTKGLVGYWTFDEGMGHTIHDLTTNHEKGLLEDGEAEKPLAWAASDAPLTPHDVILMEDFEDHQLDARISTETTGGFNSMPGIKEITGFGSDKAFGFGISSCLPAYCFDDYVTKFKIEFPEPVYITHLIFKEMELFGNAGSQGQILLDGNLLSVTQDFGRVPVNDQQADVHFRIFHLNVNASVTSVELQVRDITKKSEIYIDDLKIFSIDTKKAKSLLKNFVISPKGPTAICPGESIKLAVPKDKNVQYIWMKNGEIMDTDHNSIMVKETGVYAVHVVSSRCGSTIAMDSTEIKILNTLSAPTIMLEGNTIACLGDRVKLSTPLSDGVSYQWFRNGLPVGSDSHQYDATEDGIYSLELSYACGGTVSGTNEIQLTFDYCSKSGCVIFPNAFSPNADGLNDEFKPITNCELATYELLIFNRWGEIIFLSNNPDIGWDGYHKGKVSLSDTYLFKVTYQYKDDLDKSLPKTEHGAVTLLQ